MTELSLVLIVGSFVSGFLMFLAPCTLPLVPAYLAFISGTKAGDVSESARRKLITNALAFCVGFSVVFILFGVLAGFFGSFVNEIRTILLPIGGGFIALFGLVMLNLVTIPYLSHDHVVKPPRVFEPGNPLAAFTIGATFALGWSPCIGPVLATILLLAAKEATVVSGGVLLLVFSLGLSVPFILTALLYARASKMISQFSRYTPLVNRVGGAILVVIGFLIAFDLFGLFVGYGQTLFMLLGLEVIFEYL